jgi:GT2 family glycosyltransferase
MSAVRKDLAFVVATMDRPLLIARLLESLVAQTVVPGEVIVADGGATLVTDVCRTPRPFSVRHLACRPPSASRQRNAGIGAVGPGAAFVGFLDDDILLEPRAVEAMMAFFDTAPADVGGAAFNMSNHPPLRAARWKCLPLVRLAGMYSRRPGAVMKSGFQTMIGAVEETVRTGWLPSGAVVWRREALRRLAFDEWFSDYAYLEDLDFSYRAAKSWTLAVVAEARYTHYPQASSRLDARRFGNKEVANRLHFVRKNPELSVGLCRLGLGLRMLMSLADGLAGRDKHGFRRALGNLDALLQAGGGRRS